RPRRDRERFGHVLGVASLLGLDQQPLQVIATVLPPLLAPEVGHEFGVKGPKGCFDPFELCQFHGNLLRAPCPQEISLSVNLDVVILGLGALPADLAQRVTDRGTWGYAELVELADRCYEMKI